MILRAQGILIIDMVDFWAWVKKKGFHEIGNCVVFDQVRDAVVINDTFQIESVDFWQWLLGNFEQQQLASNVPLSGETVFGVPAFANGEITVSFAIDSSGDPRAWSTRPKCLLEWVRSSPSNENVGNVGDTAPQTALARWLAAVKKAGPGLYTKALHLATTMRGVHVFLSNEDGGADDWQWVITPESDTSFWLEAFPTEDEALAFCKELGWPVLQTKTPCQST